VPGIGKKTAERLLLELKGKLNVSVHIATGASAATAPATADVLNALLGLGYSEKEALLAIKELPKDVAVSDGIRQALKLLAKS
jgi:Holliday junction DNA helicase RuvA